MQHIDKADCWCAPFAQFVRFEGRTVVCFAHRGRGAFNHDGNLPIISAWQEYQTLDGRILPFYISVEGV